LRGEFVVQETKNKKETAVLAQAQGMHFRFIVFPSFKGAESLKTFFSGFSAWN
jgi:hypothetical protein